MPEPVRANVPLYACLLCRFADYALSLARVQVREYLVAVSSESPRMAIAVFLPYLPLPRDS